MASIVLLADARWAKSQSNCSVWAITFLNRQSCTHTTSFSFLPGGKPWIYHPNKSASHTFSSYETITCNIQPLQPYSTFQPSPEFLSLPDHAIVKLDPPTWQRPVCLLDLPRLLGPTKPQPATSRLIKTGKPDSSLRLWPIDYELRSLSPLVDGYNAPLDNMLKIDNIMIQPFIKSHMFVIPPTLKTSKDIEF